MMNKIPELPTNNSSTSQQRRVTNILLTIIVVILVGTFLHVARNILFPFVIAAMLFFIFRRVSAFLVKRLRMPHIMAHVLIILFLLTNGILIGMLVYASGRSLVQLFPVYQERFLSYMRSITTALQDSFPFMKGFFLGSEQDFLTAVRKTVFGISSGFMDFVKNFLVVLLLLFFMLLEEPYIERKTTRFWNPSVKKKVFRVMEQIDQHIGNYLSVKMILSVLTSILSISVLLAVRQDFAFLWGALIFFFNFIPVVGSVVVSTLCVLFSILQFLPNWTPVFIVGITLLVTQMVVGNVLDPKFMGDRLDLSPLLILFSLFIWGWLWGVPGMFLAVPLTLFLKIIILHMKELNMLHVFFAGNNDG